MLLKEFDAERGRVRALIEGALFRLQSGESGRLETFEVRDPRDAAQDSRMGSGRSHSHPHSSSRVGYAPPSVVQHGAAVGATGARISGEHAQALRHTPSALRNLPGVSLTGVRAGQPLPQGTPELLEPLEPSGSWPVRVWRGQPWLVVGLFATIFFVTTMLVAMHRPPAPPSAPELAAAAPAPAAPPAAAMAAPRTASIEMVVLSVSVTPSTASIAIDGVPMPSNPFVGHFPKAPGTHRIRASAPGHAPKERLVSFDDNVMIDLSLVPQQASSPPLVHATPSPNGRHNDARHWESPSRHDLATTPARSMMPVTTPAMAPPPVVEAPPKREKANDIVPRGEWEPPRKRVIDTSNPYGEDK